MYTGDELPSGLPSVEVVEGELVSPDEELYTDRIESILLDDELFIGEDLLEAEEGETETELELAHTINELTAIADLDRTLDEFFADMEDWYE
ncbi:MAG: hypothetical protein F6J86_20720 [Symploca sp. SIO1B1]|nr:hypothetical protein [Symploca sp. SIO1B1]